MSIAISTLALNYRDQQQTNSISMSMLLNVQLDYTSVFSTIISYIQGLSDRFEHCILFEYDLQGSI